MKTFGKVILVGAAIVGGYALFVFDPSVATNMGGRVNNLGLMQDRQNLLIASCAAAVIGCIMMVFSGRVGEANHSSSGHTQGSNANYRHQPTSVMEVEQLKARETFSDALKNDNVIVVRQMLADGAVRAYQELPTGRGFLQFAIKTNAVKCIPLLLAAGADAKQRDSTGKTSLDFYEEASSEVQALLVPLPPDEPRQADLEVNKAGIASQLEQLASLHAQGILTAEEFALAKVRVLTWAR